MTTSLRIGIAGLGTVGAGTVRLLQQHGDLLSVRCGRPIVLAAVAAGGRGRARGIDVPGLGWCDARLELARDPGIDVVVELIGGSGGIARELVEASLAARKHVVTANKALLAHHGTTLARAAEAA